MTYTQAQIDKANAVDLEKFLRAQGETLVRSGKEYRWKAHDSLTVCGNKWFRHSQSKGGYPVDFVMEFYGKSFPEAVQMLTGELGEVQPEADPTPSPAFRLPLRNVTNPPVCGTVWWWVQHSAHRCAGRPRTRPASCSCCAPAE